MFKFLLKLFGLDKYEYPEVELKPVVQKVPEPKKEIPKPVEPVKEEKPQAVTEALIEKEAEKEVKQEVKADPKPAKQVDSTANKGSALTAEQLAEKISGLKVNYAKKLIAEGFASIEKIKSANDSDLVAIKGIGKATVKLIRKNS